MARRRESTSERLTRRVEQRAWPLGLSVLFILTGLLYIFRWGQVVDHVPTLWISPQDLWTTFVGSSQLIHGHISSIYQSNLKFVEFPGILVALAPLAALSGQWSTTAYQITKHGPVLSPNFSVNVRGVKLPFLNAQEIHFGTTSYVLQPHWVAVVDPFALLLACIVLFACDALAERLQISRSRRAILCLVETVLLWNVTVLWGHPEDAIAVALAVYALIYALDRRFVGAGWLFGAALAFQPLVLLMLPVLIAMAGRKHWVGMAVRSVLPAAVLLALPFTVAFHSTFHAVFDQPSPPGMNHVTPWTSLSPGLGGGLVAAGPIRLLALALAIGLGFWVSRRWLERPELLVWSCALALALRSYTESVMTPYYAWAALAVAVVVAARASTRRFGVAIFLAIGTTVLAQVDMAWFPWWCIQIAGLTGLLAVASAPAPLALAGSGFKQKRDRERDVPDSRSVQRPSAERSRPKGQRRGGSPAGGKKVAPAPAQSATAVIRARSKAAKQKGKPAGSKPKSAGKGSGGK